MKKFIILTVIGIAILAAYGFALAAKKSESKIAAKTVNSEMSPEQATVEQTKSGNTQAGIPQKRDALKSLQVQASGASSTAAAAVQMKKSVIASGGGMSSTTSMRLGGTIGQTAIGLATTTSYSIGSGFWYGLGAAGGGCCVGITGDLDSDGTPNTVVDLTFIVDQIFRGGPDPLCMEEGDLDGDGTPLMVQDMTVMIDFIYRGGAEPSACPSPSPA